ELVELRVPERRFLVAPVVDRPVVPRPTGWRKRPVPCRSRWLAGTPGCGSVPPRRVVEVTAVVIAVPWAAGTAGSARTVESGATRSTGSVVTRAAGSVVTRAAGSVVTRAAGSAGPVATRSPGSVVARSAGSVAARSAGSGATWPTGSTRPTRPARSMAA